MPNMDGTGPRGFGAMSGKGIGPCGGGQRRCFREYRRMDISLTLSKDEQKTILQSQLKSLEAEKLAIENRLKEMK